MMMWAAVNTFALADRAWDPYPYILLNLFLSMLAGLQGAILLIAAKRQDAIASAMAEHDYDTDKAAKAEIEQLTKINEQQLAILRELQSLPSRGNGCTCARTSAPGQPDWPYSCQGRSCQGHRPEPSSSGCGPGVFIQALPLHPATARPAFPFRSQKVERRQRGAGRLRPG